MRAYHPRVKLYMDPKIDAENAARFVNGNIKRGRPTWARSYLPNEIAYVISAKLTPGERAKKIKSYAASHYRVDAVALAREFAKVKADWKKAEKPFYRLTDRMFSGHSWPKARYTGFGSVFCMYPRFLDAKSFYFPLANFRSSYGSSVIAHEMLHFIFFDYVEKNYGIRHDAPISGKPADYLWALSEAFNAVIARWEPYRKVFPMRSKPYPETMEMYLKMKRQWNYRKDVAWLLDRWL